MNRRAIVTGASRGIGRAVTEMLLAEDWEVWGLSRTDPGLDEHDGFWWVEWDLSEPSDSWELQFVLGTDPFEALVHCAGIRGPYGPLTENDPEAWVQTIQTNLIGTYRVVRAALPALQRSDDGRILLMSGGGAFNPAPNYSAYAVSKAGTVALMETLAAELDGSLSVNCVAPGFVATEIHAGTPYEGQSDGGDAMQVAVDCVRHLLSPATRGLTGKTVSAAHDDFRSIDQLTVDQINASEMGTRTRHTLQRVREMFLRKRLRAV